MTEDSIKVLEDIEQAKGNLSTRSLDMSLNELASMYKSLELIIHPAYQRTFRWSHEKQSQFIESLILEMPIPPIFVIEQADATWELIDGLQRMSTYLHFAGILPSGIAEGAEDSSDDAIDNHLILQGCDIVPALNGHTINTLPTALLIRIKRQFMRVQVVERSTNPHFRYWLFKRLNTGGETLSDQEVRNCTIRLLGEHFNDFLLGETKYGPFQACVQISDEKKKQMGDTELVLRFFAFKNNLEEFRHDVGPFLTNYMERVTDPASEAPIPFDYSAEKAIFEKTFRVLDRTLTTEAFQRWLGSKFGGAFSNHLFEALSIGLARIIDRIDEENVEEIERLKEVLVGIKKDPDFQHLTTGGGKNSPGPYKMKITFVEDRVRALYES